MKKIPKFKIGDSVIVHAVVKLDLDVVKKERMMYRFKTLNTSGLIVGAVHRFTGRFVEAVYPDEQSYLTEQKPVLLWQVRTGYLNKPVEALEKDIEPTKNLTIPWKYCSWSERDSNALRKEMLNIPRDARGRWIG